MTRILAWPAFTNRVQNPYNWLLYKSLAGLGADVTEFSIAAALRGTFDILHIHWPEMVFEQWPAPVAAARAAATIAVIDHMRRRGTRIVWTVHNLGSHDRRHPFIERRFYRAFQRRLDGFIALSTTAERLATSRHPLIAQLPRAIIALGHFRSYYPDGLAPADAKRLLRLPPEGITIGSFGRVRAYKNLPELVAAFNCLEDPALDLLIAGDRADDVSVASLEGPRIHLHLRHVAESEIQTFHRAADLVILPYRDILNSASAMLALSFDRPLVLPATPTMRALQTAVGNNWIFLYEPPLSADTIKAAVSWASRRTASTVPDLSAFDWEDLAGATLSFYRSLIRT